VGLKFFERVGSEDKLYDFIVEADPVKAIGSDRFARDFRSFRRHSEKGSSALVEMMAPRRRTIETSALEAEFLTGTLSNCNLLAVSIGTPVRDSRYVLSSFDALRAPLPAALVDRGACGVLHRPGRQRAGARLRLFRG
jgi:hypothetical protein